MNIKTALPLISIITVTRNVEPLLRRTIDNVARQTSRNFEYVVVDGASSDGSVCLIDGSDCISNWISEPDKGIYDAMNKGARIARGEWVIFMNAGDTFASDDVIERLADEIHRNQNADVIYGDVIRCGKDAEVLKTASPSCKGHRLAFCHQSVICKRELLLDTPFDISHRYSSDFKFFKTMCKKGKKFVHVNFPVARFDTTGISSRNRSRGIADNMRVILEVDGLFRGFPHLAHILPTYLVSRLRGK
ncbi:MAG: glycosyltransferase [Muribaculaceae bacterium]|nr:glycosyltransferase [Muribaculaceae bacterium]MDE6533481.1 glycosyltransferase [Muribaculaceae bacterium]